jgi:anti-anti-sigma factor
VCELEEITTDAEHYVLTVRGEVDLRSAPALRGRLLRAANDGYTKVVVDLAAASFLDSSGLNILFNFRRRLERGGGHLGLVATDASILRTLELTGLNRLVDVTGTVPQALAHLDEPSLR